MADATCVFGPSIPHVVRMRGRGGLPLPTHTHPFPLSRHRAANRALFPAAGGAKAYRDNSNTPPPRRSPTLLEVRGTCMGFGALPRQGATQAAKIDCRAPPRYPMPRAGPSAATSCLRCPECGRSQHAQVEENTVGCHQSQKDQKVDHSARLRATAAGTSSRTQAQRWVGPS